MELFDFILSSPLSQFVILVIKILSPIVFVFFLGVTLFCLQKSPFIHLAFWQNFVELQSQKAYGVGKVDFLTLLNNLFTLQENELELQGEIVEHEKAITQIEETTGIDL